jgi:hypothetical protein
MTRYSFFVNYYRAGGLREPTGGTAVSRRELSASCQAARQNPTNLCLVSHPPVPLIGTVSNNPATECTTMKTLVNEVWTQIAYHSDGHLVHTDKRSGKQTISFRVWPDIASANRTLAEGLGKIQWEDVDEL